MAQLGLFSFDFICNLIISCLVWLKARTPICESMLSYEVRKHAFIYIFLLLNSLNGNIMTKSQLGTVLNCINYI